MDNRQQIEEWNGALGQSWVRSHDDLERITAAIGAAALEAANARTGERVLDVGCGWGSTTVELARRVGAAGLVLGLDVSRPLLELARRRASAEGLPQLRFEEGDASSAALPPNFDLLFSRFGVMFFDDPVPAFRHLREALRAGGRATLLVWREPRDNPWAMLPLVTARTVLGVQPPPADPHAPGPFAFADEARVRAILEGAGFTDVQVTRSDVPLPMGSSPRDAAELSLRVGPTARLVRESDPARAPEVLAAIEAALAPHADASGAVRLMGSTWIVKGKNPA